MSKFIILVCGHPHTNTHKANRLNINNFLTVLQRNHAYSVLTEDENDDDCYQALIQFDDETITLDILTEFFDENSEGETWHVQASISRKQ